MIFQSFYWVSTLLAIGALGMALVDAQPRWLLLTIAVFPVADIYIVGLSLFAVLAVLVMKSHTANTPVKVFWWLGLVWGLWGVWSLVGYSLHGLDFRRLSQFVEFILYGGIGALLIVLCRASPLLVPRILAAMVVSALFLSCLVLLSAFIGTGWPPTLLGRNESAFVIVLFGILPIAYLYLGITRLGQRKVSKFLLTILVTVMIGATVAAEARAATLVAILITASLLVFHSVGRRMFPFVFISLIGAALFTTVAVAQGWATSLLNTEVNFSNAERINMLLASVRLFEDNPIFGSGWGTGDSIFPFVRETILSYPHPHNTFARFAVELGVGGLAFLLLIFGRVLYRARELSLSGYRVESYWLCILAFSLLALSMVDVIFYGASRAVPAMMVLALCEALPVTTYVYIPVQKSQLPLVSGEAYDR